MRLSAYRTIVVGPGAATAKAGDADGLVFCRSLSLSRFRVSTSRLVAETLFDPLCLLTHDGFGLGFGHPGLHESVKRRVRVTDAWGRRHGVTKCERLYHRTVVMQ